MKVIKGSAGSGKTKVMLEEVIQLSKEGKTSLILTNEYVDLYSILRPGMEEPKLATVQNVDNMLQILASIGNICQYDHVFIDMPGVSKDLPFLEGLEKIANTNITVIVQTIRTEGVRDAVMEVYCDCSTSN